MSIKQDETPLQLVSPLQGGAAARASLAATNDATTEPATAPEWLLQPFQPISLAQLNAKADMLRRQDNKYVLSATTLKQAVAELAPHFNILEIEGRRDFTYETCYFDDASRTSYFDHHRGRRKRCKVRMRKYVDTGLCYVEVKLKAKRGITVKKRLPCAPEQYGTLNAPAHAFINSVYKERYKRDFDQALEPVIDMRYQRVTLVAKQGGERMTIDFALQFTGLAAERTVDEQIFVLETKSANGNGIADKILRMLHQHPTRRCSKYCVGMAALQQVPKYNKFLVALRKLDIVPAFDSDRQVAMSSNRTATARAAAPVLEPVTGGNYRRQLACEAC